MSRFPRYHTAEEVARRLIAGLEDGSLTLSDSTEPEPAPGGVKPEAVEPIAHEIPPQQTDASTVPQLDATAVRG